MECGEFFVICYQNIIEAVNHEQHAQRSITAKIDVIIKSVLIHKIWNDYTAPGLKNSFVGRNVDYYRDTDLSLPEP